MDPRATGPRPDAERDLRHTVEEEQLRLRAEGAAALARQPAEWFDIFADIVSTGVRQTLELSDAPADEHAKRMREQEPYFKHVRSTFQSHGLPLDEEIEIEGPEIGMDSDGVPRITAWPRGVYCEFTWPNEGSRAKPLRFEGQSAIVAVAFIQWWVGFQHVYLRQQGREVAGQRRLIQTGSREYIDYLRGRGIG